MIFNYVVDFLLGAFLLPVNALPYPDSGVVTQLSGVSASMVQYLQPYNAFFPVDTLMQAIGIVLAINAAIFSWRILTKILNILTAGAIKI